MLSSAESTIEAWPPAALDIRIRGASVRDYEALCMLFEEMDAANDGDSGTEASLREQVAALLRDRQAAILVASAKGGLAAVAVLLTRSPSGPESAASERVIAIRDFLVRGDCRGRRVGRRLLAAVVEWARQRRATRVEVATLDPDSEVARFYTSFGFSGSQEGMVLAV
jgi:GNAT superfamily N-acetyltransferase